MCPIQIEINRLNIELSVERDLAYVALAQEWFAQCNTVDSFIERFRALFPSGDNFAWQYVAMTLDPIYIKGHKGQIKQISCSSASLLFLYWCKQDSSNLRNGCILDSPSMQIGHTYFAFSDDPSLNPQYLSQQFDLLIQGMPTDSLVRFFNFNQGMSLYELIAGPNENITSLGKVSPERVPFTDPLAFLKKKHGV